MGERSLIRACALGFAAAAAIAVTVTLPSVAEGQALGAGAANAIPGSYLVVFKDGVSTLSSESQSGGMVAKYGGQVKSVWSDALHGYAATMTERQAKRLAADSAVAYVEQDQTFHLLTDQNNPPSWGLDRIDQRALPLNARYTYTPNGAGVTVYVIDTGTRTTHNSLTGRATWGTNTTGDGNNTDCNGHGTHVSGTIAGTQYGVAKGARIVAVKVLTCSGSGSTAGVVSGINFVTQQHAAGAPAAANMSLGGGISNALDTAVRNSIADGVTYAIASGNSNANACNFSPARVTQALTVNASTQTDARASFSNFGTCTDIFAPGRGITSAWNTSNTATNTISGTSMATPHVAGAAALYLQGHPTASPAAVATALINNGTAGVISNAGGSQPLLFTIGL